MPVPGMVHVRCHLHVGIAMGFVTAQARLGKLAPVSLPLRLKRNENTPIALAS
jgi:hypothetical protein